MSKSVHNIHKLKVLNFDDASCSKKFEERHCKWEDRYRSNNIVLPTEERPRQTTFQIYSNNNVHVPKSKYETKEYCEMPYFKPYKRLEIEVKKGTQVDLQIVNKGVRLWQGQVECPHEGLKIENNNIVISHLDYVYSRVTLTSYTIIYHQDRVMKKQYTNTNIIMDTLRLFNKTKYKCTGNQEDKIKKRNKNEELEQSSYLYIENECNVSKKFNKHGDVEVLFSRDNVRQNMDGITSHNNMSGVTNSMENNEKCIHEQQSSNSCRLNGDRKKRSRNTLTKQKCACTTIRTHHTASATQMTSIKPHQGHPRQQFKLLAFPKNSSSSMVARRKSPSLSNVCVGITSAIRSIKNTAIQATLGSDNLSYPCICKSPVSPSAVRPQQQSCEPCLNKSAGKSLKELKSPTAICPTAICPQCTSKKHIQHSVTQGRQTQEYLQYPITQGTQKETQHPVTQGKETEKLTQHSVIQERETKKQSKPSSSHPLTPSKEYCNDFAECDKRSCQICIKQRMLSNKEEPTSFKHSKERGYSENSEKETHHPVTQDTETKKHTQYSVTQERETYNQQKPSSSHPMNPSKDHCKPCQNCFKPRVLRNKEPSFKNFEESGYSETSKNFKDKLKYFLGMKRKITSNKSSNSPYAKHFHEAPLNTGSIAVRAPQPNCEPYLKNDKHKTEEKNFSSGKNLHEATSTASGPIAIRPNCGPCLEKSIENNQKLLISPRVCCPYCSRVQGKKPNIASDVNQIFSDVIIDASCEATNDKTKGNYPEHDKISQKKCIKMSVLSDIDACSCHATKSIRKSEDSNSPSTVFNQKPVPQKSQTSRDAACEVVDKKNNASCTEHITSYEKSSNNFDSYTCLANKFKGKTTGTNAPCTVHLHKPTSCHAMLDASCEVEEKKTKATCTKHSNKICYEKCFKPCIQNIFTAGFKRKPKSLRVKLNTKKNFKPSQTSNTKIDAACDVVEKKVEATNTDNVDASTAITYTISQATEPLVVPHHEHEHVFSARACLKYFLFGIIILIWSPFIIMVLLCWLLTYLFRSTCLAKKRATYRERLEDNHQSTERKQQRPFAKAFFKWVEDAKGKCYGMNSVLSLVQETPSKRILRKLPDLNPNRTYEIPSMESREREIKPIDTEGQIQKDKESQTAIIVINQPASRHTHIKPYRSDNKSPSLGQEKVSADINEPSKCCVCGDKKTESYPRDETNNEPYSDYKIKYSPSDDKNKYKSLSRDNKNILFFSCDEKKSKCCLCGNRTNKAPSDDKKNNIFFSGNEKNKYNTFPCGNKSKYCVCDKDKSKSPHHDKKQPCGHKNSKCCVCRKIKSKFPAHVDNKKKTSSCGDKKSKCCDCSDSRSKSLSRDDRNRKSSPSDNRKSKSTQHDDKYSACCEKRNKSPARKGKKVTSSCGDKKKKCCVCDKGKSISPPRETKNVTSSSCSDKKRKCCVCGKTKSKSPPRDDKNRISSPCDDKKNIYCPCGDHRSPSPRKKRCSPCGDHKKKSSPCGNRSKPIKTKNKSTCIRNEPKTGGCCKVQPSRCPKSTSIVNRFTTLRNTVHDLEAQIIEVPPDCEDLYLQTLKRKPCFCLYKCCPDLYPYVLAICDCYRSFIKVVLYVLMTCVWLPLLFCLYCFWELLSCFICL